MANVWSEIGGDIFGVGCTYSGMFKCKPYPCIPNEFDELHLYQYDDYNNKTMKKPSR